MRSEQASGCGEFSADPRSGRWRPRRSLRRCAAWHDDRPHVEIANCVDRGGLVRPRGPREPRRSPPCVSRAILEADSGISRRAGSSTERELHSRLGDGSSLSPGVSIFRKTDPQRTPKPRHTGRTLARAYPRPGRDGVTCRARNAATPRPPRIGRSPLSPADRGERGRGSGGWRRAGESLPRRDGIHRTSALPHPHSLSFPAVAKGTTPPFAAAPRGD